MFILFTSTCSILILINKSKIHSGYLTLIKNQQDEENNETNVIENNESVDVNLTYQTAFFINEKSDNGFNNIQAIKYFVNNNWFYAKSSYEIVGNYIILKNVKINTFFTPAYLIGEDESLISYIFNGIF